MTPSGVVLIVVAALSVQIMQTSTQLHKQIHRCRISPLRPLPQPGPEPKTSIQKSPNSVPNSVLKSPATPLSKSSSTANTKSSDSVLKSPTPEQKSTSSVMKSLNAVSKFSSDSLTIFKLPLQLISRFLSPLLPSTTKRNTSSVVAPLINFNMPLTFSTIHSSNPVPCKTNSPIPCYTQSDTKINNTPCNHQPYNIINNSPAPCNSQPGTTNNVPIPYNPIPCTNTSLIPSNTQKNESNNAHYAFIYYLLCSVLLNKINYIDFCNTSKPPPNFPITSTVNPPTTTPTDSASDDTQITTQIDDKLTTTTNSPHHPSTSLTSKEETIPTTASTSKYPSTSNTISSTSSSSECTSDGHIPPCKFHHMLHKPYLPPIHISKPTPCQSLLPHTSDAPIIRPHFPIPIKLHPPPHSSLEILKSIFNKPITYKPNDLDLNSQELFLKFITSLTSNLTSGISTNT